MPPQKKVQCEKRLILFIDEPFHPILSNHRLRGKLKDLYSINVAGDMRALYRIIDAETIEFVLLDTHSNLYE
ncbi:MAG: hypothetical protein A3D67_00680 [Candidatus Lloydbacteria bacterium RIFCSPHIGHO2_02_FULL_51_22]|uniref:Uncharacterized protein n=3 Tax=Candidatus Lloydiibacteriota TaxID=1817910 RepID=A0A1G2DFL1_9BACT|nr:MAG: hypothetical protein A3D67_00680 [Candidatus Lloydbacteria bacterium RIFCSPHIGHO2_02_FULL_51_22]OGZ15895.1 MAG: hypothetical protein A3J08_04540 [Candidatus Lloydbacteria bacterium RIFCSPLOWO2_02_FULL_51_11]OGZ16251.1 MAG: hypothetical protein A3G11_00090 [Candidatus Lloydbacteria bacterium RIFCSPLOWO2_12_FULL_51_9]